MCGAGITRVLCRDSQSGMALVNARLFREFCGHTMAQISDEGTHFPTIIETVFLNTL